MSNETATPKIPKVEKFDDVLLWLATVDQYLADGALPEASMMPVVDAIQLVAVAVGEVERMKTALRLSLFTADTGKGTAEERETLKALASTAAVLRRALDGEGVTEVIKELDAIVPIEPDGKYIMVLPPGLPPEAVESMAKAVTDWYEDPNSPLAVIGDGTRIFRVSDEEEDEEEV